MSRKGRKQRSHGKVDQLPVAVKNKVEFKLVAGDTYKEISDALKDDGYSISPSSVHRYGQPWLAAFEDIRKARDYAAAIAQDNIDRPSTETQEANNAIITQRLMKTLVEDALTADEQSKIASAVAALQGAQVRNEKLKIDARKAGGEVRSAMNALKNKVFEEMGEKYPELAETVIKIAEYIAANNEDIIAI